MIKDTVGILGAFFMLVATFILVVSLLHVWATQPCQEYIYNPENDNWVWVDCYV